MSTPQTPGPYLPIFIDPPEPIGHSNAAVPPKPEGMTVKELLVIHHTARFMRIHGDQAEIVCRLNPAMEAYVPFLSPEHPYNAYYSYVKKYNITLSQMLDSTPAYGCLLPPGWKEQDKQLREYITASSESCTSQPSAQKAHPVSIDLTPLSSTSGPHGPLLTDAFSGGLEASDDDDSLVS
ncbi:hypothetical protein FOL47_007127 [Perkinsus chesapeaki]|uniref:SURP motif domain-containing protein n=1 Tax=Perkinsus chesapeaki TaxID=330153 RepID=A0A7J6MWR8_PERCH|nr:hypothetical protein FOL47_007127 [Perkinsus chesapeaki]